jgi:hypothetical protein
MFRRQFTAIGLISAVSLMAHSRVAHALSVSELTGNDASSGLRLALEKGATAALGMLATQDGFMGNDALLSKVFGAAK